MASSKGPTLALALVRMASVFVPYSARRTWRDEWEAELLARWEELHDRSALTMGARADLLRRATGSLVDAVFYGEGGWTMSGFWQDVRFAARSLARRPGFATIAVLTLVVGIGANTAIYSVARDVLLRPFPYPEPDKVVAVQEFRTTREGFSGNVTYPNIADLDEAATSFEAIGAVRWWVPALEDDRGSVVLEGATVTANFFEILGVEPGEGRFFRPDEQGEGRDALVVISHSLWVSQFGADAGLVGTDIRLSGASYQLIGVTSSDFEDPWIMGGPGDSPQVWRTVPSPPSEWPRSGRSWRGIGRVRTDVSTLR